MATNQLIPTSESFAKLLSLSDAELSRFDIALLNLACAFGLPGAEGLDVDALLGKLNEWVDEIQHQTQRNWYRFLKDPGDFENSPGYFRILVMITVLQRDLGVRYNPARVKDPKFQDPLCVNPDFRDSRDLFIHGILAGPGGTCSSMPVLYAAAARRLFYPVFLVEAKDHLYCRWQGRCGKSSPRERFNIEGSGQGFGMYSDEFYRKWPQTLNDFDVKNGSYGRSRTPREELAGFLTTRGHCLLDNGRRDEAIECFRWSVQLAPHDKRYELQLNSILNADRGHYVVPSRNPFPPGRIPKIAYGTPPPLPCQPIKIAFGTSLPSHFPPGTPFQYVSAEEADLLPGGVPMPGRVYKIAAGRPWPACLPLGTPARVVPPHEADDLPGIEDSGFPSLSPMTTFAPRVASPSLHHLQGPPGFPGLPGDGPAFRIGLPDY